MAQYIAKGCGSTRQHGQHIWVDRDKGEAFACFGHTPTADELREQIIDLWNNMGPGGGWIPGAAYKELAEVLGVDPDRLVHYDIENHRRHIPEGVDQTP